MARKRKTGFASVLSSLPPDVKLGFAAGHNKPAIEPNSDRLEPTSIDDLIVQRVHVTQETQEVERALAVEHEEPVDDVEQPASPPPRKKQKISESGALDAASIQSRSENAPTTTLDTHLDLASLHYKTQKNVPAHLKKYFYQRHRFFSLYDEGCLLDEEGWYSVTPEKIALQIAERCRCDTVIDAFCGVGGNAIAFAQTCERVIALDISPTRLAIAKHNAAIYGVADRIDFILCDYISFAKSFLTLPKSRRGQIDVVFLSPPWGGSSYISGTANSTGTETDVEEAQSALYTLKSLTPIPGAELFALSHKISRNIAMFLPRNTNVGEISALAPPGENVEIEEEWMGSKLKALTCYYGGLARGQGHLF